MEENLSSAADFIHVVDGIMCCNEKKLILKILISGDIETHINNLTTIQAKKINNYLICKERELGFSRFKIIRDICDYYCITKNSDDEILKILEMLEGL